MAYRSHDITKDQRVLNHHKLLPNTNKNGTGNYLSPLLDSDGTQLVKISGGTHATTVEGLLTDIKTNTNNINVNVGDVEVNTQDLEDKFDTYAGAGNNNIGEGSVKLQIYNYGRDVSAGNFKPMVVNSNAEQIVALGAVDNQVLDNQLTKLTEIDTAIDTIDGVLDNILTKNTEIDTAVDLTNTTLNTIDGVLDSSLVKQTAIETLITSSNTKLDTLETSLTSMEAKMDTDNGVYDNQLTKLTEIDTAIDTIDGVLDNILTKNTEIDTAVDLTNTTLNTIDGVLDASLVKQTAIETLITSSNTKLDTLETSLTSMEAKMDTDNGVYDNQLTKLTEIDTAIDTIDSVLDASLVKQTAIETLITSSNTKLDTLETSLTSMEAKMDTDNGVYDNQLTKLTEIDTAIDTIDSVLDATLVKITNNETLLTAIDSDTNAIKTAVELIDNSVDTVNNYLNVNLNIDGTDITSNTGNVGATTPRVCIATNDIPIALVNTKLDTLEASLTSMESKMDVDNVVYDNQLSKLTDAETHLGNIDTGIDVLEACVSSNKVNVVADLGATDNAVLDDIAQKLGDIETAVQLLDNCVSGNELQVDIVSGGSSSSSTARLNIDTGASELADNELTSAIDCSAFSDIAITYPTTQTSNSLGLFIKGATASNGTYHTFAMMKRKEMNSNDGGGGQTVYVWGTGGDQHNSIFIPCIYPFIKIENKTGSGFADSDNIRIVGK